MPPWPICAKMSCGLPAFFKLELVEDGNLIEVHLCFVHVLEAQTVLTEVSAVREEERRHLEALEQEPPLAG